MKVIKVKGVGYTMAFQVLAYGYIFRLYAASWGILFLFVVLALDIFRPLRTLRCF